LKCGEQAIASGEYDEIKHDTQESGTYYMSYDAYGVPDTFKIYAGTSLIYNTGSVQDRTGSPISFHYDTSMGVPLRVEVNEPGSNRGTAWEYMMYCPSSSVPEDIKNSATPVGGGATSPNISPICPYDANKACTAFDYSPPLYETRCPYKPGNEGIAAHPNAISSTDGAGSKCQGRQTK